eukprot:m.353376 g.353376  ORF g.353376 m.353376 type:complete len:391 (+) comp16758_c0_seq1:247-1419(+)
MRISINEEWYDLTAWAHKHPGGTRVLERFDGQDATEHFYSMHSEAAIRRLANFRPIDAKEDPPKVAKLDLEFGKFREQLRADGWWNRNLFSELAIIVPVLAFAVAGTYLSTTYPLLAIALIGLAMQQGGWLGHDFEHGRSVALHDSLKLIVSGWIDGFNHHWWNEKHDTHHLLTNHSKHDSDIHNQPVLFLWAPIRKLDTLLRPYQHLYFPIAYSFLYASWRMQSVLFSIKQKQWQLLFLQLLPGYIWLFMLPAVVSIGSVLFGGLLVAVVVTMSHESEEIVPSDERISCFVENQFRCTRNIECPDVITEYLFGGMQYQLEHHLFPTMPRYKYRALKPLVQEFAQKNGLKYLSDPLDKMLGEHYNTLRKAAQSPAKADQTHDAFLLDWEF